MLKERAFFDEEPDEHVDERKPLENILNRFSRDASQSEIDENPVILHMGDEYSTTLSIDEEAKIIGTEGFLKVGLSLDFLPPSEIKIKEESTYVHCEYILNDLFLSNAFVRIFRA